MAIVLTDDKHYKNIASTIRERSEVDTTFTPEEMPEAIEEVYGSGYQRGWGEGRTQGEQNGMMMEQSRFWGAYQQNGNRTDYDYAFRGDFWTDEIFTPKHDITPTTALLAFHNSMITNIKAALVREGVTLDTSNCTNLNRAFYGSKTTALPKLDFRASHAIDNAFTICRQLAEVSIVVDESVSYTDAFYFCFALENLTVEGTIGKNGFDVHFSPLTHDSLMSIINALQDKSTDTSGAAWAVTLGTANLAKLTDEEKAIATEKGWTLV